jgi:ligand-binding sensor domain-containing protein
MNKYKPTIIFFIISFVTIQAQVTQINFPKLNIDLKKIIQVKESIYLALAVGDDESEVKNILFLSKDACKSWSEYSPTGISNPVCALYTSNNTIYAADIQGYVYKTEDIFSEWDKIELQTGFQYINEIIEHNDYLIIGSRANAGLNSAVLVYDLKKQKKVNIKKTIPGKAGVNTFYKIGGRVIAGTNNGFYYEEQPDLLSQSLNRAAVNPEKEYPVGEYWYYPAKYTTSPSYVYDKLMPVNEFKNLFVGDIQYSFTSGNLFAATYKGLYYSKHDGLSWGKLFQADDGNVYEIKTNKDIKDYLSHEMISKVIPFTNYLVVETDEGKVFYSDYKNNKYDNWKQFIPPNKKIGPVKVYMVDQNKLLVKSESNFSLINDVTKYIKVLR